MLNTPIKTNPPGFSLIEIILSIAVFGILVVSLITGFQFLTRTEAVSDYRTRALFLAEEGLEAVRNIRDANFSLLTDGPHGLSKSGNIWQLSGTSDVTENFTRVLTISTVNANLKSITATVTWPQGIGPAGNVSLTTELSNWQALAPTPTPTPTPIPTNTPTPALTATPTPTPTPNKVLRTTEYYLAGGQFSGTSYELTLNQDLMPNYFVIIQGSDGDGGAGATRGPNSNYAALTADPNGTGDLAPSGGTNKLIFTRGTTVDGWIGVVTVVECLTDCNNNGFVLRDVKLVSHGASVFTGTSTIGTTWSNVAKVVLFGGSNGSGCTTSESNSTRTKSCHTRLFPSGTNTINWARSNEGNSGSASTSTVMAVEWGSAWNVQRVTVTGSNGGTGINATGEYNTATITSVVRANTWVWGTGITTGNGVGREAEGIAITLGNGVAKNANETRVAVGLEHGSVSRTVDVYTMTHPSLNVDHQFKADGDSPNLTIPVTVASASDANSRFAINYNGAIGTGTTYPQPMFSARYTTNTTITLERRRTGATFAAWVQGIDTSNIINP